MCNWPVNSLRLRGRIRAASGWFLDALSSTLGTIPPTDFEDFEGLLGFDNCSTENSACSCLSFGMAKKQQFSGLFEDSPHRKRLALWAFRANQHHRHFACAFVKLRHKPQLIGAARQTPDRELPKRAFAWRLWRLIILSALKTAGGIHGDSLCRKVGQSLSMSRYSNCIQCNGGDVPGLSCRSSSRILAGRQFRSRNSCPAFPQNMMVTSGSAK